jgi:small neutral amino acid transporter SnatA (MarC family)
MKLFLFMLVMINPFAQVVYLHDLMTKLSFRDFAQIHLRATLLSLGVFALFAVAGETILNSVFQVRLAALQIFGGLIMLYVAHRYITNGAGSNLLFNGDISTLSQEITLPYMVGPGTIWVSILIGHSFPVHIALLILTACVTINMIFVVSVRGIYARLESKKETFLGKYFSILMRVNALLIGAIAVEMILRGIETAFPIFKGTENQPGPG